MTLKLTKKQANELKEYKKYNPNDDILQFNCMVVDSFYFDALNKLANSYDDFDTHKRTKFYEELYDLYVHPDKIETREEKYYLQSRLFNNEYGFLNYYTENNFYTLDTSTNGEVKTQFTLPEIAEIEKKYPEVKGYKRIRA
ncbi:MAG: hypothetical protein ABF750_09260 [Oenococcus oeni]